MKLLKHLLLILTFGQMLWFTSCCTKKKCDDIIYPQLYLNFINSPPSTAFEITITRLDLNSHDPVDSYKQSCLRTTTFDPWLHDTHHEASDFVYVISGLYNSPDTIFIDYAKITEQVECNTCFPVGDGKEEVTTFWDFRVQYQGSVYWSGETLFLE